MTPTSKSSYANFDGHYRIFVFHFWICNMGQWPVNFLVKNRL